jgi:hypothetical protein
VTICPGSDNAEGFRKGVAEMTEEDQRWERLVSLINKLISSNDQTFEAGLTEVKSLAKSGDQSALEALRNAIIQLSGDEDFKPYKPGVVVATGDRYSDARDRLVALAARKAFLKDPHETQDIISAFNQFSDSTDFARLVDDVYRIGGSQEAHALLLLNIEMWCYVQLNRNT